MNLAELEYRSVFGAEDFGMCCDSWMKKSRTLPGLTENDIGTARWMGDRPHSDPPAAPVQTSALWPVKFFGESCKSHISPQKSTSEPASPAPPGIG